MTSPVDTVISILDSSWNTSNYNPKPLIKERTKTRSINLQGAEYILIQEMALVPEYNTLSLSSRNKVVTVDIDIRTRVDANFEGLKTEVERIMNSEKFNFTPFCYVLLESGNELSNKKIPLFRYVFKYRMKRIGELV